MGSIDLLIKWSILARYDSFSTDSDIDREEYIAGVAYDYNKNVQIYWKYISHR